MDNSIQCFFSWPPLKPESCSAICILKAWMSGCAPPMCKPLFITARFRQLQHAARVVLFLPDAGSVYWDDDQLLSLGKHI